LVGALFTIQRRRSHHHDEFGIMGVNAPYGDGVMGSTSDYIGLAES
jgi:hypothetical protein